MAIGCASVLLSRETLREEFMRGVIPAITVVAILITTLLVFVLYLFSTQEELDLAREYAYVEKLGALHWQDFAIVFVLALSFGGIIAFVTNLLLYSAVIIVLQIADSIGAYMVQNRLFRAYQKSKAIPDPIYDYYLVKPQFVLRTARLVAYTVAFVLAVVASFRPKAIVTELAWVIIVITTITYEYVIYRWRLERHRKLPPPKDIGAEAG